MFLPLDSLDLPVLESVLQGRVTLVFERDPDRIEVRHRRVGESGGERSETTGPISMPDDPGFYVFRAVAVWPEGDSVIAFRVRVGEQP